MVMRINNNLMAMNTHRQLQITNGAGAKSVEKLSSGFRINRAGDDAAGLAISEKMRAQIRGLNQASRNSQDAISLIQTAEGAMNETHAILQRMRELAVQSANDTNVTIDREQIQKEVNQLTTEINRIGNTTEFNTMKLLNGEKSKALKAGASGSTALDAGNVAVNSSISGYTIAGDAGIKAAISSITTTADEFTAGVGALTGGATITVLKNANDTYTVSLDSSVSGAATFSAVDTLSADADGNFVYNDHGVSFTITKEENATISAASTTTVTTTAGATAQSYALENDWVMSSTNQATITSGITVALDSDNASVRSIDIKSSTAGITVDLKDSAGTTVQSDVFSAQASLSYNDHGITFEFKTAAAVSASGSISASISLTGLGTTTTYVEADYDNNAVKFQVGANQNQFMDLAISDVRSKALGITSETAGATGFTAALQVSDGTSTTLGEAALDVSTHENAASAITVLNSAIEKISSERSNMGAVQNRLEHTIKNLDTAAENLQASESRIRDVDMAKEMMEFTKNNILTQAAQAMLAQANQAPQGVLQLLR
jgi:flagellin